MTAVLVALGIAGALAGVGPYLITILDIVLLTALALFCIGAVKMVIRAVYPKK